MQVEDRIAGGRAARSSAPRSSHAEWKPGPERSDPVAVLELQATTRVQDLIPLRHARMLVSPFTFYRGAAAIMAADLAATPTSGIRVQCCGDAHLANFGGFESPERRMVFDINDFDETLRGPWEWDVKRLAASLVIAAQDREFDDRSRREQSPAPFAPTGRRCATLPRKGNLDVWYARLDVEGVIRRWRNQVSTRRLKRSSELPPRRSRRTVSKRSRSSPNA